MPLNLQQNKTISLLRSNQQESSSSHQNLKTQLKQNFMIKHKPIIYLKSFYIWKSISIIQPLSQTKTIYEYVYPLTSFNVLHCWIIFAIIFVSNYLYMHIKGKASSYTSTLQTNNNKMNSSSFFICSNDSQDRSNVRQQNLRKAEQKEAILILTDEEEKAGFQQSVQSEHLRYEISKAQLTGNRFNIILAATKYYLPVPSDERDKQMKAYIHQFVLRKANIDLIDGYFCSRIDAGLCSNPGRVYQCKYLLFGVDLLTTKKILVRFTKYNPIIKWIDASHCTLEFVSIQQGWDFLAYQVLNFDTSQIVPWEQNQNILARNWIELNPYMEIVFARRLFARNLTEMDEHFISARQSHPPQSFEIYKHTKMDLESHLLANENVKKIMDKVDEQERTAKMMDPNYRNIMRKKRMEQKKIEHLISERNKNFRNESQHRDRSRTRDDQRHKRHQQSYRDHNSFSGYEYEPKPYSNPQFDNLTYKGNPKVFPQRYGLHKIHNPTPRPRPSYATPEKISEIRQQLSQRPNLDKSYISHQNPTLGKTHHPNDQYQNELNKSYISDVRNKTILTDEVKKQPTQIQKISERLPIPQFVKLQRGVIGETPSQTSSDYRQIQSQLQRFHINTSEYSSIFERSKHNISNIPFQDSNQLSSQFVSSNLMSNNSEPLFQNEVEQQIDFIPHCNEGSDKLEDEDVAICNLLAVADEKKNKQPSESNEPNFRITKKAIDIDDPPTMEEPPKREEVVGEPLKKRPRKKKLANIAES